MRAVTKGSRLLYTFRKEYSPLPLHTSQKKKEYSPLNGARVAKNCWGNHFLILQKKNVWRWEAKGCKFILVVTISIYVTFIKSAI